MPNKQASWTDYLSTALRVARGVLDPTAGVTDLVNSRQARLDTQNRTADAKKPITAVERAKRDARQSWQAIGQLPAGIASMTVANSNRNPRSLREVVAAQGRRETGASIGNYRPVIADVVPGTLGAIGTLLGAAGLPTTPSKGGYLANSMERMGIAGERTNEALGISPPQDALETVLNAAGTAVIPGPEGVLSRIPAVARVGSAITNAGKAGKVAKGVYEGLMPLRQGRLREAVPIQAASNVVLQQGFDKVADDPNYHSIGEANTVQPVATPSIEDSDDPLGDAIAADDLSTDSADPLGDAINQVGPPDDLEGGIPRLTEEEKQSNWLTAAEVLGGIGLVVAGGKVASNIIKTNPFRPLGIDSVVGHGLKRSKIGALDKFNTQVFDSTIPIRSAANQSLTPDAAKQIAYDTDRMSSTSIGSRVIHFMNTGKAPSATRNYTSPAKIAQDYTSTLSPADQDMVANALLYASSLDDFNRTGVNSSFSHILPADKQRVVAFVQNSPTLAPHFNAAQQSYKELNAYNVDVGLRSVADHQKFSNGNPNYAHMSQDISTDAPTVTGVNRFDAQQQTRGMMERNVAEERAGVQANARNPIHELPTQWANTIRLGVVNQFRKDALEQFHMSGAMNADGSAPLVRKLPAGQAPKAADWDKIHTVFENGVPQHYQVNDPSLDLAMKLHSRAGVKPLEAWRQINQSFMTGSVGSLSNGFMFLVSPFYETQLGAVLRAEGTHQGYIKALGPFDPTQKVSAWTGALGYAMNDLTHRMATTLTDTLLKQSTPMQAIFSGNVADAAALALGPTKTTALRDLLQRSYETSTKALMDEIGASSGTMRGSPDSLTVSTGLEDAAPSLAIRQGIDSFKQAMANEQYFKGALAGVKVPWIAARSSSFGQMVSLAQESMRNGFAYANVQANRGPLASLNGAMLEAEKAKLASNVRLAGVDTSKHGANEAVNVITGSIPYSNLALQTMYGIARRAAEKPVSFTNNTLLAMGSVLGVAYAAMADPDVVRRNNEKTPEQRVRSISLPGGMEMPVEQSFRLFYGPARKYFDHISGASTGNYDPNFFTALETWFDHPEDKAQQEELSENLTRSLKAAWSMNNPADPNSAGPYNTVLALEGVDPRMTALQGQAVKDTDMSQTISGIDSDKTFVGGLMSTHYENLIITALGSFADHMIRSADEIYRANGDYKGPVDAMQIVGDRWKDVAVRGSTVARPLFGEYESVKSVADANYSLTIRREKGIKAVENIYNKDVRLDTLKGIPDPAMQEYLDSGVAELRPEYQNTILQGVGVYTQFLNKQLRPLDQQLAELDKEKQRIAARTDIRLEKRNEGINTITEQRKAIYYQKLMAIRQNEDAIATSLNIPNFTYDGFDPQSLLQH